MVNLFTTRFRLNNEKTIEDVLFTTREWIVRSPNNNFDNRFEYIKPNHTYISIGNSTVISKGIQEGNSQVVGVRYINKNIDNNDVFMTDLIFNKNDDNFFDTSISIDFQSNSPLRTKNQNVKKPLILRYLFNNIGPGYDGRYLLTSINPFLIQDSSYQNAKIIGDIISGKSGNVLPIIYISKDIKEDVFVDYDSLANNLHGEAHILVEPNRSFSFALRDFTKGNNAFNGAIGIYWPNRQGHTLILPCKLNNNTIENATQIESSFRDIQKYYKLPLNLTWLGLERKINNIEKKRLNQKIIDIKNRNKEKTQVTSQEYEGMFDDFVDEFETVLSKKDVMISDLECQVKNLEERIKNILLNQDQWESKKNLGFNINFQEIYKNEINQKIIEGLKQYIQTLDVNTRKYEIINQVINIYEKIGKNDRKKFWNRTKKALIEKPSKRIKDLRKVGWSIVIGNNHNKIFLGNNETIKEILSKTPSDHKEANNCLSQLKKRFD